MALGTETKAAPMTVAGLIAALQAFPPETPVFVDGYEWGVECPFPPRLTRVYHHGRCAFGGDHSELGAERPRPGDGEPFDAVLLSRDAPPPAPDIR